MLQEPTWKKRNLTLLSSLCYNESELVLTWTFPFENALSSFRFMHYLFLTITILLSSPPLTLLQITIALFGNIYANAPEFRQNTFQVQLPFLNLVFFFVLESSFSLSCLAYASIDMGRTLSFDLAVSLPPSFLTKADLGKP